MKLVDTKSKLFVYYDLVTIANLNGLMENFYIYIEKLNKNRKHFLKNERFLDIYMIVVNTVVGNPTTQLK